MDDAAALAEANASAVHAERLAAEAELASLVQEEQRVSKEVAAAEHHDKDESGFHEGV